MRIRSFFVYTVLLQTFSMLLLWGVWIAWLKYAYLPGLSEDFNAQQMVIARGVSDTLRETPRIPPPSRRLPVPWRVCTPMR